MVTLINRPTATAACSAVLISIVLSGCWAQPNDIAACSSSAATETLQRLVRKTIKEGSNALQFEFMDFDRTAIGIESIRTLRSTPEGNHCQASVRTNIAFKDDQNGRSMAMLFRGKTETTREMRYWVQLTDEGKVYVTLNPRDEYSNGVGAPSEEGDE